MNLKGGKIPGYLALALITLIAGLALGATYSLTEARIHEQALLASENARKSVFREADEFCEMAAEEGASVDWIYEAIKDGNGIGYVAQATVNGFAGPVEVIAGVDASGTLTGISVGGSGFKETAGLGEKTKHEAFTVQFAGKSAPLRVIKAGEASAEDTVDAVTAATVSSTAVTNGVNTISAYIEDIKGASIPEEGGDQ